MDNFIDLMDGTRLEVKFNFGTLYFLTQCGGNALAERIQKKKKKGIEASDIEKMKMSSKVIYSILRSNGLKITEEEAMQLMPPDVEEIQKIFDMFEDELEKQKKKEKAKANMRKMTSH